MEWQEIIIPVVVLVGILFCGFSETLDATTARKVVHMGVGLMALLATRTPFMNLMILIVAFSVMVHVWYYPPPLRFARRGDEGITMYALVVIFVVVWDVPTRVLAPMFFADPLAQIVGSRVKSPVLYGKKTVAGTMAAFVVTFLALPPVLGISTCCQIAALVSLAELFGGKLDNLAVSVVSLAVYFLGGERISSAFVG